MTDLAIPLRRRRFISVCSGIEAASLAFRVVRWASLALAEIDPFPCFLLAERWGATKPRFMPDPEEADLSPKDRKLRRSAIKALDRHGFWGQEVVNFGDFTRMRDDPMIGDADVLCGGTPCQTFSLAGLRGSLEDQRGNLTLEFVRLADAIDAIRLPAGRPGVVVCWENVPGVLSTKDNAFGCFLAALVGADAPLVLGRGQRWTDAGLVIGPKRAAAWRVLDAQFFGLAQRRRRVVVVSGPREGFDPSEILFERESVRGNPQPSREAGSGVARALTSSLGGPSAKEQQFTFVRGDGVPLNALGPDGMALSFVPGDEPGGELPDLRSLRGRDDGSGGLGGDGGGSVFAGGSRDGSIAGTVSSKWSKGTGGPAGDECQNLVAVEVYPITHDALRGVGEAKTATPDAEGRVRKRDPGLGVGDDGDPSATITAAGAPAVAIAFSMRGRDGENMIEPESGDVAPAVRTGTGGSSKAFVAYSLSPGAGSTGKPSAVETEIAPALTTVAEADRNGRGLHIIEPVSEEFAFKPSHYTRGKDGAPSTIAPALSADADKGDQEAVVLASDEVRSAVRRLTPRECERLQGFPDDYTLIDWPAPTDVVRIAKIAKDVLAYFGRAGYLAARLISAAIHPDGPRFKALGNSWPVPVFEWLSARVENHLTEVGFWERLDGE